MASQTLEERFNEKWIPIPECGCWIWIGCILPSGHGRFKVPGSVALAHRFSYNLHCGPIPEGFCVLHSCAVPGCVNPDHLFVGDKKDWSQLMITRGRHWKDDKDKRAYVRQCLSLKLRGESSPTAKLTETDVINIRLALGPLKFIADDFGISQGHISDIRSRKAWKHLP